jgi:DNA-binding response OmpR family regulator
MAVPARFHNLIILTVEGRGQSMSIERWTETPVLIGQAGALQGGRWLLNGETLLIGRGPECDVVVPDRQVSRHHARVRRMAEGEFELEDLGSKNGTHVNGVALQAPRRLADGDVIQVALAAKLLYVGSEATMPLSMDEDLAAGAGRLRIDRQAHRIWVAGVELDPPLSPPQYRLLELLVTRAGQVVNRDEIIAAVWEGSESEGISEQAIDALVRRLRERLGDVDPEHTFLVTVRGHGFRLDDPA